MNTKNTVIKLDNVSKRFNIYSRNIERIKGVIFGREPAEVVYALKDVSLEVHEGERITVFGIVDSGRSTLAKVITGVTFPSSGKVNTFGKSMNVMLDPKAGMDVEFSCIDNIYMKANIVGITKEEIKPHIDEILEFAEITDFADLPLKRAPKGAASLMALAVHLVKDADLVICDEVFGGGGNRIMTKCESRMVEYAKEHPEKTIISTSNRVGYALRLGTRAIVLDNGVLAYDGDVEGANELFVEINTKR